MKKNIKKNKLWYIDKAVSRSTSNGMKKISLYILIALIIINFFLPFGIVLNNDSKSPIEKNVAWAVDDCTIVSAGWNPSGEQSDTFYKDGLTVANIIIKTKNCVGQSLKLSIVESDGLTDMTDDYWDKSNLYYRPISVLTDNLTAKIKLGEEDCETILGGGVNFDCDLFFELHNKDNVLLYKSYDQNNGHLYYECDGLVCYDNAELLGIIENGNDSEPVNLDAQQPTNLTDTYKLLAPIGNLETAPKDIGAYFNLLFKIAIGLCGALAVIMIVIGGVQYMGDESVFGKTEAKSKITSAILGLIIALGSYALLNTIDPNLLGGGGLKIDAVSAEITPLYDRGISDPKKPNGESVNCTPVLSGPCSVSNLTPIFGAENAVAMSKICNMESGGRNATSGTDICKPGDIPFSFGLFQINLAANGKLAGADCVGLFDKAVRGSDAIEPKYNSGFSCKLLPGKEALYNTCKNILLDPNKNLEIAKKLFTPDKRAWLGDKRYCASAFE